MLKDSIVITKRMELYNMIKEALSADLIKEAVSAAFEEERQLQREKLWLTKKDLIELTGWSYNRIYYLMKMRYIPFIKQGSSYLFPAKGIHLFLEQETKRALRKPKRRPQKSRNMDNYGGKNP